MAESTPLEDLKTVEVSAHYGYFKMQVLHDHQASSIGQTMGTTLAGKNIVFSDKSTSYINISYYVDTHYTEKSDEKTSNSTLKWVYISISNAKRDPLWGIP